MVWICSECEKPRHHNYESHWKCDCNVNGTADVTQKSLAIGGGGALAFGGLIFTLCIGGVGAILVGGVMLGAGVNSTWTDAEKAIKKERINGKAYAADVAFGAVTGAATGEVGAVGETVAANIVKQGAKEVAEAGVKKLAVRAATGAVVGVVSKSVDEVKQCSTTDKRWADFGKTFDKDGNENRTATAWVASLAVGGLGDVGSNISSNLSKQVTSGIAKSVTRVAVSGTTAAAADATIQGANIAVGNQDRYDFKRTVASTTASVVMATAQEGTKNAIYRSQGGKDNMRTDRSTKSIIKEKMPENDRQAALEKYENLKKISDETTRAESLKAREYPDWSLLANEQDMEISAGKSRIEELGTKYKDLTEQLKLLRKVI